MKTKEEVIKDAYGEYWYKLDEISQQNALVENGWLDFQDFKDCGIAELYFDGRISTSVYHIDLQCDDEDNSFFRPLVLQGIENNNGWIKIESEDDLPKEDGIECYIFGKYNDNIMIAYFDTRHGDGKRFYDSNGDIWSKDAITHYQPIIKPKPPIY